MCGISGIVNLDGSPVVRDVVNAMTRAIAHRGPDDEGTWFGSGVGLGHRRLSIIDLSSAGHQPMTNEDGTLWITYNGEVYNAADLRPELERAGHVFCSKTDTEVILHAYEEWGPQCLARFNGMFAFAIWNERERTLFAARDQFGIKPFFYHFNGRQFAFGSEIKALFKCPEVPRRPNLDVGFDYLAEGYLERGHETFFEGILQLAPGHALSLDGRILRIFQYYKVDPEQKIDVENHHEVLERFRDLLQESVALRFVSDVTVATNLSGGLDSTALVSLAIRHLTATGGELPHHTFSACFDAAALDERPFIEQVSAELPLERHYVFPAQERLLEQIEEQTVRQDQPVMSAAMIAKGEVMRLARDTGIKVVLEGQGADEYLCGYTAAARWAVADLLHCRRWLSAANQFRHFQRTQQHPWVDSLTGVLDVAYPRVTATLGIRQRLRGLRRTYSARQGYPWLGNDFQSHRRASELPRLARGELDNYCMRGLYERHLPFYLRCDDHNAMAFGVEAREPFLDHRLVEFVMALPGQYRINNGMSKWILRESLRGIVPESIRTYPGKRPFPTPQLEWLRGPEQKSIIGMFMSLRFRKRSLWSAQGALDAVRALANGDDSKSNLVWRLINYETWLRCFGL